MGLNNSVYEGEVAYRRAAGTDPPWQQKGCTLQRYTTAVPRNAWRDNDIPEICLVDGSAAWIDEDRGYVGFATTTNTYQEAYYLVDVDMMPRCLLLPDGDPTGGVAETLAMIHAVLLAMKRNIYDHLHQDMIYIITDFQEILTTYANVCNLNGELFTPAFQRMRANLRKKKECTWRAMLLLLDTINCWLPANMIVRIQTAQSMGIPVRNHRWHLPETIASPHEVLARARFNTTEWYALFNPEHSPFSHMELRYLWKLDDDLKKPLTVDTLWKRLRLHRCRPYRYWRRDDTAQVDAIDFVIWPDGYSIE